MMTTPAPDISALGGFGGGGGSLEITRDLHAAVAPKPQIVRVIECSVSSVELQATTPCSRQHRLR